MPQKKKKVTLKYVIKLALKKRSFFEALVKNWSTALNHANLVLSPADRRRLKKLFTQKIDMRSVIKMPCTGVHPPPPPWKALLVKGYVPLTMKLLIGLKKGGDLPIKGFSWKGQL